MPGDDTGRPGLKLKKKYYETQVPDESPTSDNGEAPLDVEAHRQSASSKRVRSKTWRDNLFIFAGWLVFLALCAGLLFIRFVAELPGIPRDSVKLFGMIGIGVIYGLAIVMALKDNMFDGLLSILVPFYPVYYLFCVCGSVFLRALAAAFMLAFGYDCVIFLNKMVFKLIDYISTWMKNV